MDSPKTIFTPGYVSDFFCEKYLFSSQMELNSGCRLLKCCSVYPDESSVVLTGNDFRNRSPYFVEKTQILFFSDNFQVHIEKWVVS